MVDISWIYTAITRTTDINNIYFFDDEYNEEHNKQNILERKTRSQTKLDKFQKEINKIGLKLPDIKVK